jgi:putative membrane-bound dehydrogenase-like protein
MRKLFFIASILTLCFGFVTKQFGSAFHTVSLETGLSLQLPTDWEVKAWSSMPNATAIEVDIRGRVWLAEKGRLLVLDDTDQDGKADKTSIFIEDTTMHAPLGLAHLGNKVLISCSPNLLVFTDENADDKADKKDTLLTGFGGTKQQTGLHSVVAGADGNWYGGIGNVAHTEVTDLSGWTLRTGQNTLPSADGRTWVGGLTFRITPNGRNMKVVAHNAHNPTKPCLDSFGNGWQSDADDDVMACRTSFVMEGSNVGYLSRDGGRQWQTDRRVGQDLWTASWHQEDPQVMPAGSVLGEALPTSMTMYEGDVFGKKYRGMLMLCDAQQHRIVAYTNQAKGAGFELTPQTLISVANENKVFSPIDICVGTDGSIFVLDTTGYIYRFTPKNGKKLTPPKIDLSTIRGQIKALTSPATNVRFSGFEALRAEGTLAIEPLKSVLDTENPYHQARAIWLLSRLGREGQTEVETLLKHPNATIRLVALRALRQTTGDIVALATLMATDPDPAIRREVAISLRDEPLEMIEAVLPILIDGYDGKDIWYLNALAMALDGDKAERYWNTLKTQFPETADQWSSKMENLAWALHTTAAISDLKSRCISNTLPEESRKKALVALAFIKHPLAAQTMLELAKTPLKDISTQAILWLNFRRNNEWATFIDWDKEMPRLLLPAQKRMVEAQRKVLNVQLPLTERLVAARLLAKDIEGGNLLINWQASKQLSAEIAFGIANDLLSNPDKKVRLVASNLFPRQNDWAYKADPILRMKGDSIKGKAIFAAKCANCHAYQQQGNADIGGDLSGIGTKTDKTDLLDALLNPSATMPLGYETWTIVDKKGQNFTGLLAGEGKLITLKDAQGQLTSIKVEDIKTRQKNPQSLMPDAQALKLSHQHIADVLAFLGKD